MGPKCALPIDHKAGVIGIGSLIGFPFMPSWLCNVRRKATEDWLTALKRRTVGTDGTIKGSQSPWAAILFRHASQHQNFTCTSPLAALSANIDGLRTDLCLLVRAGVVVFESFLRSDGEGVQAFLGLRLVLVDHRVLPVDFRLALVVPRPAAVGASCKALAIVS